VLAALPGGAVCDALAASVELTFCARAMSAWSTAWSSTASLFRRTALMISVRFVAFAMSPRSL
jgi:hypothetical protein